MTKFRIDFINADGITVNRLYKTFASEEAAKVWTEANKTTPFSEVIKVK